MIRNIKNDNSDYFELMLPTGLRFAIGITIAGNSSNSDSKQQQQQQ